MPDRIIARRNSTQAEWRWSSEQIPGGTGHRGPGRRLLLAGIGAVVISVGVILLELSDDSSGSQPPTTQSPTAGASVSPGPTDVPTEPVTATPSTLSQSPVATGDVRLFVWSRQDRRWLESENARDEPGYREDEAVPFMLRIEDTVPTTAYEVALQYECRTAQGAAFDYLSSVSEADSAAQMIPPGPARREDSAVPIPDDPSITFDGGGRRFQMWGGTFDEMPEGPSPAGACETEKRIDLSLLARSDILFLMWGAHLASSSDWGENAGASSQTSSIYIEASVNQTGARRLGVGPDAIAP